MDDPITIAIIGMQKKRDNPEYALFSGCKFKYKEKKGTINCFVSCNLIALVLDVPKRAAQ